MLNCPARLENERENDNRNGQIFRLIWNSEASFGTHADGRPQNISFLSRWELEKNKRQAP